MRNDWQLFNGVWGCRDGEAVGSIESDVHCCVNISLFRGQFDDFHALSAARHSSTASLCWLSASAKLQMCCAS